MRYHTICALIITNHKPPELSPALDAYSRCDIEEFGERVIPSRHHARHLQSPLHPDDLLQARAMQRECGGKEPIQAHSATIDEGGGELAVKQEWQGLLARECVPMPRGCQEVAQPDEVGVALLCSENARGRRQRHCVGNV